MASIFFAFSIASSGLAANGLIVHNPPNFLRPALRHIPKESLVAALRLSLLSAFAAIAGLTRFTAGAQEVLAPPPSQFVQTPVLRGAPVLPGSTNSNSAAATTEAAPAPGEPIKLFDIGPAHVRPHLLYRLMYGTGLQSQPGKSSNTLINEFSPGVAIGIGNHWNIDYTSFLQWYSSPQFRDTLDHAASIGWGTTYGNWGFGISQSYGSSSAPLAETASQTPRQNYTTAISAGYQVNSRISLDFSLAQSLEFVGDSTTNLALSDSKSWSTTEGFSYDLLPGISVGMGVTLGYDKIESGPEMASEQLQGRVSWKAGEKLAFALDAGAEDRQFLHSTLAQAINPVFGVSAEYRLFEPTRLSLAAARTVAPSLLEDRITISTLFTATLQQRFKIVTLDIGGGFGDASYQAAEAGLLVNREDKSSNINVRLSRSFLTGGVASVFYNWSHNSSNEKGFEYSSNQTGFELGYRF